MHAGNVGSVYNSDTHSPTTHCHYMYVHANTCNMPANTPQQGTSYVLGSHKDNIILQFCNHDIIQWSLSKSATCGPVLTERYREVAALQR